MVRDGRLMALSAVSLPRDRDTPGEAWLRGAGTRTEGDEAARQALIARHGAHTAKNAIRRSPRAAPMKVNHDS